MDKIIKCRVCGIVIEQERDYSCKFKCAKCCCESNDMDCFNCYEKYEDSE